MEPYLTSPAPHDLTLTLAMLRGHRLDSCMPMAALAATRATIEQHHDVRRARIVLKAAVGSAAARGESAT